MNRRNENKIEDINCYTCLDLNESNFEHPENMYTVLNKPYFFTNYVPTQSFKSLINHITDYNKIKDSNIILNAGSNESLELITKTYNKKTFIFVPTYNYFISLVKDYTLIPFDIHKNDYDIDDYLKNYNIDETSMVDVAVLHKSKYHPNFVKSI